jgi:hypothetical protein
MDLKSFKTKLESYGMKYSEYNGFWRWKIGIEANGKGHILDNNHRGDTSRKLLDILPGWQTYRGVKCDYETWLPVSLNNIANAYDQIRNYSLLDFDKIPDESLKLIWHELGRVKTESGNRRGEGDYFVISVCKPLMFMWGQTPAFDSKNRDNMYLFPLGNLWYFRWWKEALEDFQKELLRHTDVINYCREKATEIYNSEYVIPYGRFLDIYYYEQCGQRADSTDI